MFRLNDMFVLGGDDCRVVLWNLSGGICNGILVVEKNVNKISFVCVIYEV